MDTKYRDFRHYLEKADPYALAYTGNDARIDPTKKGYDTKSFSTESDRGRVQSYITNLYNQYLTDEEKYLTGQLESMRGGGSGIIAPPPINTAQIQAQARKQAQKSVNPYYNRLLSQFKKNQARKKTEAVEDRNTTLTRIDEALQRALEGSDITRGRTEEDVTANLQEIAAQEDFNQTTEGTQFDRARQALAGDTAQAGLTTSGLGKQAESEAISDRNLMSKEEARRVNVQEQAQETFRTRTFQDLERADKESKRTAGEKKEDTKIDFDRYIKDLAYSTKTGIQDLEKQRKSETAAQTRDIARQKTLKWIESIGDPLVRNAAYNAYGGLF